MNAGRGSRRRRGGAEAAPPIAWAWAAALGFVAVAGALVATVHVEVPPSEAFEAFNRDRLRAFAEGPRDAGLRVVLLGNSRLKFATLLDAPADGPDAAVVPLRIANDWAVFSDFAPLADDILGARPDAVVIQAALLAQERGNVAGLRLLRDYAEWRAVGRGQWNPGRIDQHALQFGRDCVGEFTPEAVDARLERTGRWLTLDPAGGNHQALRAFVARAAELGIAVVVVRIPSVALYEEAAGAALDGAVATGLAALPGDAGVRLLRFPDGLDQGHYCDIVHMNERGRVRFTAWLVDALHRRAGGDRVARSAVVGP